MNDFLILFKVIYTLEMSLQYQKASLQNSVNLSKHYNQML